jgi:hypothetical protein
MHRRTWQKFESRIAALFGGQRRGAYTGNGQQGKTDIIANGYAIECKLLSRPSYQAMLDACLQAETNAESPLDIPLAVIKRKGDPDKDALVIMRLDQFQQFFINQPHKEM